MIKLTIPFPAIEEDALRIVVQFKQPEHSLYPSKEPNELVIELYEKKVYFKINSKKPTMDAGIVRPELILDYENKFENLAAPEPYEFVIHEVLRGNQKSCRSRLPGSSHFECSLWIFPSDSRAPR
jgi:glucose-6-phosphate 1-dehydrogenase